MPLYLDGISKKLKNKSNAIEVRKMKLIFDYCSQNVYDIYHVHQGCNYLNKNT